MKLIQEKLKKNLESQTLKSLDRISMLMRGSQDEGGRSDLNNIDNHSNMAESGGMAIDAFETAGATSSTANDLELKGENRVPVKISRRRKHSLRSVKKGTGKATAGHNAKKRPRYFCKF